MVAQRLLRRDVVRGPENASLLGQSRLFGLLERGGQPEVGDLGLQVSVTVAGDEDVVRLDVPMQDVAGVNVGQRFEELKRQPRDGWRVQSAVEQVRQRRPVDVLHDQIGLAVLFPPASVVQHRHDVRVPDRGREPRLANEAGLLPAPASPRQQHLQRDRRRVRATRPKDRCHPATADQVLDLVAAVDDLADEVPKGFHGLDCIVFLSRCPQAGAGYSGAVKNPGHRRCVVLRGTPAETEEAARRLTRGLDSLHAGGSALADRLGRGFDAVAIDLHGGLSANDLGRAHGLVRGGGALILRLPEAPLPGRLGARLERRLGPVPTPEVLAPCAIPTGGTTEQALVVEALTRLLRHGGPVRVALTADRGRGKSAAMGLALSGAAEALSKGGVRCAVVAASRDSAAEVVRFGPKSLAFRRPSELLEERAVWAAIVVDEAARLSIPVLRRLVEAYPDVPLLFATTVAGYEGTGRGFVLRFLDWLEARGPLERLSLSQPIRWAEGDPLERLVFDVLALDAEPCPPPDTDITSERCIATHLKQDRLASDERLLRDVFGLLVHAHYRTTPRDLERMLDGDDVSIHALMYEGRAVAVTLLAREGGLSAAQIDDLVRGRGRLPGQALADTLICHGGVPEVGALDIVRSVRIATHPAARRLGLARRLVEHVHACEPADLYGTLFGATEGLLRFRRAVGYEVTRVGIAAGVRSGEPSVAMLHPASDLAESVINKLRTALARELPEQLALMEREGAGVSDVVAAGLAAGLPAPTPLSEEGRRARVAAYAFGPRPSDTLIGALRATVERHEAVLAELEAGEAALIVGRIVDGRSWERLARDFGFANPRLVQRALRRAVRALLRRAEPGLERGVSQDGRMDSSDGSD